MVPYRASHLMPGGNEHQVQRKPNANYMSCMQCMQIEDGLTPLRMSERRDFFRVGAEAGSILLSSRSTRFSNDSGH